MYVVPPTPVGSMYLRNGTGMDNNVKILAKAIPHIGFARPLGTMQISPIKMRILGSL